MRERREDVPLLLDHYLALYAKKYGKPLPALPADARRQRSPAMTGRAMSGRCATPPSAPSSCRRAPASRAEDFPLPRSARAVGQPAAAATADETEADLNLERTERRLIERVLQKHAYNISNAAAELGLTRGSLYRRMEKHGL